MIDYGLFSTAIRETVEILKQSASHNSFNIDTTPPRGWRKTDIYKRADGVKIFLTYNHTGEVIKAYLGFSPHIVSNGGMHNANPFNYVQARDWI